MEWTPHGKVKRLDPTHIAIVVQWKRKVVSQVYHHELLDPDPAVGAPALRLTKVSDGSTYDLIRREFGLSCECPRFERYGQCKHTAAAKALGLMK